MTNRNHVGRPSNKELRNRKIKKMVIYGMPVFIVIIGLILIVSGKLNTLMGNSTTIYQCQEGYSLKGDKCIKTIKKNAPLLGDINNDGKVSVEDSNLVISHINGKKELDEFEFAASDINKDSKADEQDYQILKAYVTRENISENMGSYNVGEEKICPSDYDLDNGYCIKEIIVISSKKLIKEPEPYESDEPVNSFKIRFVGNGGLGIMSDQVITYGVSTPISKNKFQRSGYVFTYWTIYNETRNKWLCYDANKNERYLSEKDCKNGYVHRMDEQKIAQTAKKGESLWFYAQWSEANKYTIRFSSNGGSGTMNKMTLTYGKDKTIPSNNYTRSGYSFMGWRVYNESLNKWSCYRDNGKVNTKWSTVDECKKYGYVLRKNKTTVNHTVSVGQVAVFYAQWQYNYKGVKTSFNGFEKDPKGATVWPMVKINLYRNVANGGTKGSEHIGTIPQGVALKVLDMTNKTNEKNSFVKVSYGGKTGYINGWLTMINLPDVIPSAIYNITNAKASIYKTRGNNLSGITGKDIYGSLWTSSMAPIRIETAKKIQKAETTALKYGNRIKIYDSFRPWTVQRKIADAVKSNWFNGKTYCISKEFDSSKNTNGRSVNCVTDSKGWFIAIAATNPGSHNIAKAIDVTLVTSDDNQEIATKTKMHELSGNSIPTTSAVNTYRGELALNYLFTNSGFYFLPSEWWHFEDVNNVGYSSYYNQIKCLGNPFVSNSYNCKVNQIKLAK